jgi:hypothetical protein
MTEASLCESSAEARKRRRDIIASQRTLVPDVVATTISDSTDVPVVKKRKVAATEDSKPKKPQMKYDPDVPMTKEEAAAWRREQRRKRNRESAAASRQRQRDRINELELEVDGWKAKYEDIMAKVRQLEELTGVKSPKDTITDINTRSETPPPQVQTVTPRASPTSTTSSLVSLTDKVSLEMEDVVGEELQEVPEPIKMISRPAVKITGSSFCPLLPDDEPLVAPEPCLSVDAVKSSLDPIDSTLFPSLPHDELILSSAATTDPEFGEFLLDAVDWL